MADTIRIRRVPGRRWGWRKRYDVVLLASDGVLKASKHATVGATGFLITQAGVHPIDSLDWVKAADDAFAAGSPEWITWPYGDGRRPPDPRSLPLREP